jgi:hypothetical protein
MTKDRCVPTNQESRQEMNARLLTPAAAIATALAIPALAIGSGGGGDVRSTGKCSGSSSSKIKVKPDNGRLEVEFEVDQNKNGVKWNVKLKDNGDIVFRGTETTKAPSGSFSLQKRIDDRAGTDQVVGIGRNPATGERCKASVSI